MPDPKSPSAGSMRNPPPGHPQAENWHHLTPEAKTSAWVQHGQKLETEPPTYSTKAPAWHSLEEGAKLQAWDQHDAHVQAHPPPEGVHSSEDWAKMSPGSKKSAWQQAYAGGQEKLGDWNSYTPEVSGQIPGVKEKAQPQKSQIPDLDEPPPSATKKVKANWEDLSVEEKKDHWIEHDSNKYEKCDECGEEAYDSEKDDGGVCLNCDHSHYSPCDDCGSTVHHDENCDYCADNKCENCGNLKSEGMECEHCENNSAGEEDAHPSHVRIPGPIYDLEAAEEQLDHSAHQHAQTRTRFANQIRNHMRGAVASRGPLAIEPNEKVHTTHSPMIRDIGDELFQGRGQLEHLYRSYKHTPHAVTSTLLKYLVHRATNLEAYDSPEQAKKLDSDFMELHQAGGAKEKNGHLELADLHHWALQNPHLIEDLLNHRDQLQEIIGNRGVGLNVREINGEKYVALTRGLNSRAMKREHSLSSFADIQNPSFGNHKHHVWVPLKDIWYSYDLGPKEVSSHKFGAEDEFLVGNTGQRYAATRDDVRRNNFKNKGLYGPDGFAPEQNIDRFDNATDEELAKAAGKYGVQFGTGDRALHLFLHKNAGPLTRQAFMDAYTNAHGEFKPSVAALEHPAVPADLATDLATGKWKDEHGVTTQEPDNESVSYGLKNPNLGPEHLVKILSSCFKEDGLPIPSISVSGLAPLLKALNEHKNNDSTVVDALLRHSEKLASGETGATTGWGTLGTEEDRKRALSHQLLVGAISNPGFDSRHADKVVDAVIKNPKLYQDELPEKLTPEQAEKLYKGLPGDDIDREHLVRDAKLPKEMKRRILLEGTLDERGFLTLKNPHLDDDDYRFAIKYGQPNDLANLMWRKPPPSLDILKQILDSVPKDRTQNEDPMGVYGRLVERLGQNKDLTKHYLPQLLSVMAPLEQVEVLRQPNSVQALESCLPEEYRNHGSEGDAWWTEERKRSFQDLVGQNPVYERVLKAIERQHQADAALEREMQGHLVLPLPEHLEKSVLEYLEFLRLAKNHPPPSFPKLGIADDRRETPYVTTKEQLYNKLQLTTAANAQDPRNADVPKSYMMPRLKQHARAQFYDQTKGYSGTRGAVSNPGTTGVTTGYVRAGDVIPTSSVPHNQSAIRGTKAHEDFHLLMSRVGAKYGHDGRARLGMNLYQALPKQYRSALDRFYGATAGDYGKTDIPHEEILARIFNYMNSSSDRALYRNSFEMSNGAINNAEHQVQDRHLRRAYQALRAITEVADDSWAKDWKTHLVKSESVSDLEKMAIQDIPKGKRNGKSGTLTRYDYSHVLTPEQKTAGYSVTVQAGKLGGPRGVNANFRDDGTNVVRVSLHHPTHQKLGNLEPGEVGFASGLVENGNLKIGNTEIPDQRHQGQGFGTAMYEALMAHSKHALKARTVGSDGEPHSSSARRVHLSLARKHGLEYCSDPNVPDMFTDQERNRKNWEETPDGPYDDKWGPYKYTLKSEANLQGQDLISDMLGFSPLSHSAMAAARFLAGAKKVSLEAVRRALWEHDGDLEKAALAAFQLPVTEQNLKALRAVQQMSGLSKAEGVQIKDVQPGVPEARGTAEKINRAAENGDVEPVNLSGRHSKGTLLATDRETGGSFLLKPGSGGLNPASGEAEESASQSQREAAFWHVAEDLALGEYVPRTDLLVIDGRQYAAIEMLDYSWTNADKVEEKHPGMMRRNLEPYREDGTLHRWACLDLILGNADRHGSNIMVSPEGKVRLIDHGSSMSGPDFSPGKDKATFVPYYLRAWSPIRFNNLPMSEKLKTMPQISAQAEEGLRSWLNNINPELLSARLAQYGIHPQACLDRLAQLRASDGPLDQVLNRAWVGQTT